MNTFYVQTEELCHVGVLRRSGRYPWGSGKRPFQSGGGPKESKKSKSKGNNTTQVSAAQKASETRARNKAHEEEKQRVLREGTATEVLKFKSELSTKELNDALERIKITSQLDSYAQSEMKSFMNKVDEAVKDVQTVTNVVKTGSDLYNALAKIYNSTAEGKQKPLTLISGGGDQKKDKKQ